MSNLMSHNPLITETTLKQKTLNYKQRSEQILQRVAQTCVQISDYLKIYKKYLNENNN